MKTINEKPFEVKLVQEDQYYRIYVTHPNFKGRIRKRLGNKSYDTLENISFTIRYELNKHFDNGNFTKTDVESFIDNHIALNVKRTSSIFDYKDDFLKAKADRFNKKTKKAITNSTLSSHRTTLKYFESFLIRKRITPHPSQITESVLNDYYSYITGSHNYKVKLHTKLKEFIKYLDINKQLPVDPSYKLSVFTEEYDNQCPEDNDRALSTDDINKLFILRKRLHRGDVQLQPYIKSKKIPAELQEYQFNMKRENLIRCLDCFLFMVSTGQYYSDIVKSEISFSETGGNVHIRYRRAKNGSLCKAIPIINEDIFIGKEIVDQYQIKNGSNFPLHLSLTHFDKHLKRISDLAGIGFKITNKMARKTFASYFYFTKNLPVHYLQILLGHKDVKDTAHYLRISDKDIVTEITRWMSNDSGQRFS